MNQNGIRNNNGASKYWRNTPIDKLVWTIHNRASSCRTLDVVSLMIEKIFCHFLFIDMNIEELIFTSRSSDLFVRSVCLGQRPLGTFDMMSEMVKSLIGSPRFAPIAALDFLTFDPLSSRDDEMNDELRRETDFMAFIVVSQSWISYCSLVMRLVNEIDCQSFPPLLIPSWFFKFSLPHFFLVFIYRNRRSPIGSAETPSDFSSQNLFITIEL